MAVLWAESILSGTHYILFKGDNARNLGVEFGNSLPEFNDTFRVGVDHLIEQNVHRVLGGWSGGRHGSGRPGGGGGGNIEDYVTENPQNQLCWFNF